MAKIPVYSIYLSKWGIFFTNKIFFEGHCHSTTINNLSLKRKKKMRENSQMRHSKNNQYDIMEKGEKGL